MMDVEREGHCKSEPAWIVVELEPVWVVNTSKLTESGPAWVMNESDPVWVVTECILGEGIETCNTVTFVITIISVEV